MSFWSSRARPPASAGTPAAPTAVTSVAALPSAAATSQPSTAPPPLGSAKGPANARNQPTASLSHPAEQSHPAARVARSGQHYSSPPQPTRSPPPPAVAYQLAPYEAQNAPQSQHHSEEQYVDEYGNAYGTEYDDGYGYAEEHPQQQQRQEQYQQQWEGSGHEPDEQQQQQQSEQYGDEQYEGQYDEYGPGEDEQWMDEHHQQAAHDEQREQQLMYEEHDQAELQHHDNGDGGEYDDQVALDDTDQSGDVDSARLGSLHALPSHSHPLHPVQESENEPTSPEMSASALPFEATLSSTLANIAVYRAQQHQPTSPPSAASVQSPSTPQLMALSPSSASRQRYIDCVELLRLYCRQSTSRDETYQTALKLVDALRYRYSAFTSSSAATSASASASSSGTEWAAALLRFMQSSLAPVQLQPLLQHVGRQVVEHLSLALSSVGCVVLGSPSSHVSLASSLLQSRIDALRIAFRSRSYSQPLLYVSPHHAADIEELSLALSLPASSFFVVPTMPHPHSPSAVSSIYTMDVKHLHALLTRHSRERRQSAVLLLTVGSLCSLHSCSSGYQLDDVQQLTDIAGEFGLWVHAEGSQLIESGQQHDYQQTDEEQTDDSASTAPPAPDNRNWKERYEELANSSAGVQTFVPSRVHSISLHANDYFTLPDTLAFTILTPNAALNVNQASETIAITRAAVSSNSASVLSLWSQLLAVSSRSFSALLALFPALLTLSHAKLDAAKVALQSLNAPLLLSPADYAVLPPPPFLFFSLSLTPPFNHSYFHLTASQANDLLADNLLRRGENDVELCAILCSSSLTPSSTLFSHTGFLYSSVTPYPAAVDSVERHTAAFHHFLSCVQAELAVVAACGALMPTLHSLMSNESDFELVPPSSLAASTRPGLCAFRFTPASIPPSFHHELTNSLLAELTAVLPAVFRGGECEAAGSSGSSTGGDAVIVVEVCEAVVERGVQSLVRTVHKLSRRVRLPSHVESELSAELKRSISATEAKLKAGQAGGGGVIRSIPIVGSFFSFFAGKANSKGHSYNITSSYTNSQQNSQHEQTAARARTANKDHVVQPSSNSGSGSSKATPQMKPASTPPTPPVAPVQPALPAPVSHSPVLSAASDAQDGLFSRATSAALPDEIAERQHEPQHDASLDNQPTTAEQRQQQEEYDEQQQDANETLSQPEADSLAPVNEQQLFDQLSSRNPADLLSYISNGTVLTIFFPSEPEQPDSPSTAIPLYLFYDVDSASLCWCEPGARYVVAEQTLPVSSIAELHLGNANPAFPADAHSSRCFSIVSDLIQLHCEEEDVARRDEIVLALYSLLSDAQPEQKDGAEHANEQPTNADNEADIARPRHGSDSAPPNTQSGAGVQQREQQQSSRGATSKQPVNEEKTFDVAQPAEDQPAVSGSVSGSTAARHIKQPATASSSATASMSLSSALELLETGSSFTVFLVDRSSPALTSRHPVILWFIPDSAAEGKGRLCWSRRSASAPARLEYHPSRSLLLSSAVELSLGKQTKALCNAGMEDVLAGRCVSVMVDRTVLNLAAESEAARDEWLAALHTVMINGDKKLTTVNRQ